MCTVLCCTVTVRNVKLAHDRILIIFHKLIKLLPKHKIKVFEVVFRMNQLTSAPRINDRQTKKSVEVVSQ